MIAGISVWNEHSPRIESALAENKVVIIKLELEQRHDDCDFSRSFRRQRIRS